MNFQFPYLIFSALSTSGVSEALLDQNASTQILSSTGMAIVCLGSITLIKYSLHVHLKHRKTILDLATDNRLDINLSFRHMNIKY